MNAMKSNPNVDNDWIEYCLPRMMDQMKQMSEEFKRKKMGEMSVSNDEFAKLKQALATIKGPPKEASNNFRQMLGALTMKQMPPAELNQIDPMIQKNRLIIQMRTNLRQKFQVLYYIKECRELLLKLEREIFQFGNDTYFEKAELEELSRLFPTFQLPVDHEKEQREFKHGFARVKDICDKSEARAKRQFSGLKESIDEGSTMLHDFRLALTSHHQVRMAVMISTLLGNVELACCRINQLPDTDCVSTWTKLWGQLWKLNVVPNPAPSTFSGADGEMLREMYQLFKSDYAILVDKLKPFGLVSPEYGVRVDLEHLKADDELLKKALFPKDPKKLPKVNTLEYGQMHMRLNQIEEEAEAKSDKFSGGLDMHSRLLKDAKSTRDASKRLRTWLGESFQKPLVRNSLLERLDIIDQAGLTPEQVQLLIAILTHLEEKRGWLAERFDALSDEKLSDSAVQLVLVTSSAKSDCIVQLLGGAGSDVATCLADIKAQKAPVNLDDDLVATLTGVFKSDDDVKNEDEIDLDAISDDDDVVSAKPPPVDLKSHLKGLINKVDGLASKKKQDKPRFEAISSDDDSDSEMAQLAHHLAPPPPPIREDISDSDSEYGDKQRITTIDNTSIGDYYYHFDPITDYTLSFFKEKLDATNFLGNLYEKIATTRRSSQLDKELERRFSKINTAQLANLTLILTPGDATPTYDEPRSSDEGRKKKDESAEEGECNDDGVELRPSLRIKNLPSPIRDENEPEPMTTTPKRRVMLKVKTTPPPPAPVPTPVALPVREAISSDEDDDDEEEEPDVKEKEEEKKEEIKGEKEEEIEDKSPVKEKDDRKRKKKDAKRAKKDAKKAKKEKKRADKEQEHRRKHTSESDKKAATPPPQTAAPPPPPPRKPSTDVDDITDT